MNWLIGTPAPEGSTKGNRITAERWAQILRQIGRSVTVCDVGNLSCSEPAALIPFDGLIALHAVKSAGIVNAFRTVHPRKPIVVALTGTDLHRDLDRSKAGRMALANADRVVLLEPAGISLLSEEVQAKSVVIFQSASRLNTPEEIKRLGDFEVCLIGNLRPEKDPFLITQSLRDLPDSSRIRVTHVGEALSKEMEMLAKSEARSLSRYRWLGPLPHIETKSIIAGSQLMVLSSRIEGAPSVISETIVLGTPVLATRIHACVGLLGEDYPGLFDVGDHKTLARLLYKAETDVKYLDELKNMCAARRTQFTWECEVGSWRDLLQSFDSPMSR